jgi:hypothetical protein
LLSEFVTVYLDDGANRDDNKAHCWFRPDLSATQFWSLVRSGDRTLKSQWQSKLVTPMANFVRKPASRRSHLRPRGPMACSKAEHALRRQATSPLEDFNSRLTSNVRQPSTLASSADRVTPANVAPAQRMKL